MSASIWVKIYIKGKDNSDQRTFKLRGPIPSDVNDLAEAVKEKCKPDLDYCPINKLFVYKAGTEFPTEEETPLGSGKPVCGEANTDETPLRVVAPAEDQPQEEAGDANHQSVADGVFVLYRGDDKDATPIGTTFAIASNLLLTACHNVVQQSKDGSVMEVTELKMTTRMAKSDFKMIPDDTVREVEVLQYNTEVDWACLRLKDGAAPLPCIIPIGMNDSDLPKPATLEKMFIYHCPVQLFLDDEDTDVCHVMVKEVSVGLVGQKIISFQNGGFPGSCGGPYIFRNKAIALHVDSVSTTKTADALKIEQVETRRGKKRNLTEDEITRKMVDSCVSSHSSLGSGIILHVRSGIKELIANRGAFR